MKKNIVIGVLALISILSILFALVEKAEAEKQVELAQKSAIEARKAQILAEEQRQIAIECANSKTK
ncbi:MAG: hypothetical protein JJE09_13245 [Bacteroidia bacterium]|nr:hypothetical protein [Bacteroidia bacterium]